MKRIKALTLALVTPVLFYSCASVPENESENSTNIPEKIQTMPVDEPKPVEAPWLDPDKNVPRETEGLPPSEETASEAGSEESLTEDAQTVPEEEVPAEEPVQEETAEEEELGELFIDENNPLEGLDEPEQEPEEAVTEDAQTVPEENAPAEEPVQEEKKVPEEKPSEHVEAPEPDDGIVDAPKTDAVIEVAKETEKTPPPAKKSVPAEPVQTPKKAPAPAAQATVPKPAPVPEKTVPAPVISITSPSPEESAATTEEKESSSETKKVPVATRAVTMQKNQYLDITYPGSGWIYLGEEDGKNLFRYFGRKIGTQDTSFSLRSREEGTTLLHFYKNDVLSETYLDDWLEVTVKGINTDHSRVQAPSYASVVPPKPEKRTFVSLEPKAAEKEEGRHLDISGTSAEKKDNNAAARPQVHTKQQEQAAKSISLTQPAAKAETPSDNSGAVTVIQNADASKKGAKTAEDSVEKSLPQKKESTKALSKTSSVENTDAMAGDDILNLAKKAFDEGEYSKTLTYLDAFFEKAGSRIDEGLFLQGQTLETNSEVRNIKAALDTYETIVRRYPQSINWAKANERVTYLKRFYFNIR